MTYKEFMDFALENYENGGDAYYECWTEEVYKNFCETYGEMTKEKALESFKLYNLIEKEIHRRLGINEKN